MEDSPPRGQTLLLEQGSGLGIGISDVVDHGQIEVLGQSNLSAECIGLGFAGTEVPEEVESTLSHRDDPARPREGAQLRFDFIVPAQGIVGVQARRREALESRWGRPLQLLLGLEIGPQVVAHVQGAAHSGAEGAIEDRFAIAAEFLAVEMQMAVQEGGHLRP